MSEEVKNEHNKQEETLYCECCGECIWDEDVYGNSNITVTTIPTRWMEDTIAAKLRKKRHQAGLRIGELRALKWSDINFQKRTVKISHTLQQIKKSQAERDDNLSYGHYTHIKRHLWKHKAVSEKFPFPTMYLQSLWSTSCRSRIRRKPCAAAVIWITATSLHHLWAAV